MNKLTTLFMALAICSTTTSVFAAEQAVLGTVERVLIQPNKVFIKINPTFGSECTDENGWISVNTDNADFANQSVSMALAAYLSGKKVWVWANDAKDKCEYLTVTQTTAPTTWTFQVF